MAKKKEKKEEVPSVGPEVVEKSVQEIAETGKKVVEEFKKITEDVQTLGADIAKISTATGIKQNEALLTTIRKTAEDLLKITSGTTAETVAVTSKEVRDLTKSLEHIATSATALMAASSGVVKATANLGLSALKNTILLLQELESLVGGLVVIGGNMLYAFGDFLEAIGKLGKTSGGTIQLVGKSLQK